MDNDAIKDAFSRAKQDIQSIKDQLVLLASDMMDIKTSIEELRSIKLSQQTDRQSIKQSNTFSINSFSPHMSDNLDFSSVNAPIDSPIDHLVSPSDVIDNTFNDKDSFDKVQYDPYLDSYVPYNSNPAHIPTENNQNTFNLSELSNNPTQNPTDKLAYKVYKSHIYSISTGNRGVPTNQQTNQQTNQHPNTSTGEAQKSNLSTFVNSLDNIKRDIVSKFKKLTKQEMIVFSTIYQLEESFDVDYPLIANKLSLSESSIRDYIQRIIKKGVPILKIRENNKKIFLKISPDLKKIAPLATLINIREI